MFEERSSLGRLLDAQDPDDALDIVGIGALNLDYIADSSLSRASYASLTEDASGHFLDTFEWGGETSVDDQTIYSVLDWVNWASLAASLGGSAFNAIYALAQMKLDLRLGYVGVAGKVPVPGLSSVQQLRLHGVDTECIQILSDSLCGVCFSLMEAGERTLLTHAGANELMGGYIDDQFESLLAYLSRARVVHVTSFLDSETPAKLLNLLSALRRASPAVIISFDPGHVWCRERSQTTIQLVGLSDFVLVNQLEFLALGDGRSDETDDVIASRILNLSDRERATVVLKRPDGIYSFRRNDSRLASDFFPQQQLRDEEILDATGAGDVFAAGLLAVLASPRLQTELGALLGMRLARHKLRQVGSRGYADFADITRSFISRSNAERLSVSPPSGVFIAHGGDPQWLAVKSFVETEFVAPVHSFESGVWGSAEIVRVLDKYLNTCSWAICVLTVEDLVRGGKGFARQNVIHEVGLFQGRYGSERVSILVEDGCQFFPDISSRPPMTFPRQEVHRVFWSLKEEMLTRGVQPRI